MARPYRIQIEDGFYHIISRGNDRKIIYSIASDYKKFLEYLAIAKDKFKFYVHAYCLMPNHYHLFIETTQPNLSRIMQYINTAYTVYYNIKCDKKGHLFQGRYKSILVERDSYYSELTKYIHLNPVKAKIVDKPKHYEWSSYRVYDSGKNTSCVDIDRVKQFLGTKLGQYCSFIESIKEFPEPLKNTYGGFILGRDKFIKDNLNQLRLCVESKDYAYKRAIKNTIDPGMIISMVAKSFKMDPKEVCYDKKRPILAKKMAIYLIRRKTGLTNKRIGELFKMKPSAISMAALDFEDKIAKDKKLEATLKKINWNFEV